MLRIIDNKSIDLTDAEWQMYEELCKRYDDLPKVKGTDLFTGLFLTDEAGVIVCLLPPTRQTSFEVIFFLQNLMLHQHLRLIHTEASGICKKLREELAKLKKITAEKK
jgi:hypothetical protein